MRQPLSFILPLHWMLVFGAFSALCAGDGFGRLVVLLTGAEGAPLAGDPGLSIAFSIVFALNATLFLWCIITSVAADEEVREVEVGTVAGLAFGLSIATMTGLLAVALWLPGQLAVAATALTAALAVSFASMNSERRAFVEAATDGDGEMVQATVRRMALGAAHSTMLSRISGRTFGEGGAA